MSDNGIDYGQLLPWLQGATSKDQTTALNTQAKGVNNVQDLTSLFFDPKFAALFGAYDPTIIADQSAAPQYQEYSDNIPLTQMYMNGQGGDDTMAMVASGLFSGQLTPISAKRLIMEAAASGGGELSGMDPVALSDSVDAIVTEITNNQTAKVKWDTEQEKIQTDYASKPKDDIYSRAGLPSPLETYGSGNTPIPEEEYNKQAGLANKANMSQAALQSYMDQQISNTTPELGRGIEGAVDREQRGAGPFVKDVGRTAQGAGRGAMNAAENVVIKNMDKVIPGHSGSGTLGVAISKHDKSTGMQPGIAAGSTSKASGVLGGAFKAPVKKLDKQLQTLQNTAQIDSRRSADEGGYNRGYAEILQKAGRSPLNDALEKRRQLAAMLGLV